MKIIIITVGEPPLIFKDHRLHRSAILSLELSKDSEVEYWSSNFFHQTKNFFKSGNYKINQNLTFKSIKTLGYKKNVSILRFIDQFVFAIKVFVLLFFQKNKPSLIIASLPTCDLSFCVSVYAKLFNVKYIIDVRDMWPDIFWLRKKNKFIRLIIKILSTPQIFFRNFSIKNADGLVSITNEFLDWTKSKSNNLSNQLIEYFYLSPPFIDYKKNNHSSSSEINIIFIGVISYQKFDFINLLNVLKKIKKNIKFHIFGDGDDLNKLKRDSQNITYIKIYGYNNHDKILNVAKSCHYGLANYNPTVDFKMSIPNKIIEYLSYDLDIIYCLDGSSKRFLEKNKIGKYYRYNDQKSLENLLNSLEINYKPYNSRSIYDKNFNPNKVYESYKNFIKKIL